MFKLVATFLIILGVISNGVFYFKKLTRIQKIKLTKYVGWGILYSSLTLIVMFFIVQIF